MKKTNSPGINFKRNTKIFSSGSNLKKEIFTWYQFKKISQYFHLVINWRKKIFTWYQFEKNIKIFSPGNKKLSVWRLPLRCCTQFLTLDLKKLSLKSSWPEDYYYLHHLTKSCESKHHFERKLSSFFPSLCFVFSICGGRTIRCYNNNILSASPTARPDYKLLQKSKGKMITITWQWSS